MAETLEIHQTEWNQRSNPPRDFQCTRSTSKFFEATLTRSFHAVRIPSVTSRWSCSKSDKFNCCSHETLFHKVTCEFKRPDAVNNALNSGVGKTHPRLQAVWFQLASSECCNFLFSRISRSCIRVFWTNFQFCPFVTTLLTNFVHASGSSGQFFNFVHSSRAS